MEQPPEEDIFQKQNWKRGDKAKNQAEFDEFLPLPSSAEKHLGEDKAKSIPSLRNWDNSHDFLSGGSGDPLRFVGISLWAGDWRGGELGR